MHSVVDISAVSQPDLYAENLSLKRQLKTFITKARQNEDKLHRFQELELRLIGCTSLIKFLEMVAYDYRMESGLDRVSIILHDPEYEHRRILDEENVNLSKHPDLLFVEQTSDLDSFYGISVNPYLGIYQYDQHDGMFPLDSPSPKSIALLPIKHKGELIGSLNLGSDDKDRFVPGIASDFLQRFASIVSVCLSNVMSNERLKRIGLTDSLTGVNNRRYFEQRLAEEVSQAQRHTKPLSCLFFDVDHFKSINDSCGHQAGDEILKEIAETIRACLRTSDTLARYGGEEFSALLADTKEIKAVEIAERIRETISDKRFVIDNGKIASVTISIGTASLDLRHVYANIQQAGNSLIKHADERLFRAKKMGRNRVVCSHSSNPQLTTVTPCFTHAS